MSHTAGSAEASSPAPGWYADPGGSGGKRWWSGVGWTESVQLPARPAAPHPAATVGGPAAAAPAIAAAAPATLPGQAAGVAAASTGFGVATAAAPMGTSSFVPFTSVVPAAPGSGVSRFGGPVADPTVPPPPAAFPVPASHRSNAASEPALSRSLLFGLGAAVVASLAIAGWVWAHSSGGSATPDTSGPRGPASVAAAQLDAQSLASSEETFFADHQKYLAVSQTPGVIALGSAVVHLSATDSASVVVDPAGVGYCILVVSRSATSSASSTVVYVSTAGGLQPDAVTGCPAVF